LPEAVASILRIESARTGYGRKQVLSDVCISVSAGEIVAVIGPNGAGKSTLLKAAFGLLPLWGGKLLYDGVVSAEIGPRRLVGAGVSYVPQGNHVFGDLTVYENLEMGAVLLRATDLVQARLDSVLALFPALRPRLKQIAGTLSGGEKQMVALGRALMISPRLLLLDEPSMGLAPGLARRSLEHIRELARDHSVGVLVVEQRVREVLAVADRVYVLRNGQVTFAGRSEEIRMDEKRLREVYF